MVTHAWQLAGAIRLKLSLMLGLYSLSTLTAAATERVVLATQVWTPYQTVDSNGVIGGLAVERVKCALQNMGNLTKFTLCAGIRHS